MTDHMRTIESRYYDYLYEKGYASTSGYQSYLGHYLSYLEPGIKVLDLGCGAGDFLLMARDKGCEVTGVDSDPGMISIARKAGLDIVDADAIAYVGEQGPSDSFDVVFASNFIEHIPPNALLELVRGCFRILRPNGRLILTTPNPESLHVHLYEFWRDLTHVRFYHRAAAEFVLHDCGFVEVHSEDNPLTAAQPEIDVVDLGQVEIEVDQIVERVTQKQELKNEFVAEHFDESLLMLRNELHQLLQEQNLRATAPVTSHHPETHGLKGRMRSAMRNWLDGQQIDDIQQTAQSAIKQQRALQDDLSRIVTTIDILIGKIRSISQSDELARLSQNEQLLALILTLTDIVRKLIFQIRQTNHIFFRLYAPREYYVTGVKPSKDIHQP